MGRCQGCVWLAREEKRAGKYRKRCISCRGKRQLQSGGALRATGQLRARARSAWQGRRGGADSYNTEEDAKKRKSHSGVRWPRAGRSGWLQKWEADVVQKLGAKGRRFCLTLEFSAVARIHPATARARAEVRRGKVVSSLRPLLGSVCQVEVRRT